MKDCKFLNKGMLAVAALLGYVGVVTIFHRKYTNWGATDAELEQPLPGDALMDHPASNHAVTIQAPVEAVWPWLVQIGQDRAGFYSYSFLENLVKADIHNADSIVPEWQHLKAGDTIRLGSKKIYGDKTLLPVAELEENHFIVLKGWGTFVLQAINKGTMRFIIRTHGRVEGSLSRLLHFLLFDPIHFVMERKMLLGIKRRAERAYHKRQPGQP
ncbi:hypothetical protein GCM10023188_28320 [Pontibacter saemangeumensis]|uniref:Polyketide cyclase / dehydrase and lipid transport n=1 Tax=Pontibacter saemangeumensis TaxID=1084525 RepID=A0ABP8LVH2_9BACT